MTRLIYVLLLSILLMTMAIPMVTNAANNDNDKIPPVINNISLNSTTPNEGDSIMVIVDARDNVRITEVMANGVHLYRDEVIILDQKGTNRQDMYIWKGTIIALVGIHPVNVLAKDSTGNIAWNNSTYYTGMDITPPIIYSAGLNRSNVKTRDSILVIVDTSDNIGVATVRANGVALFHKEMVIQNDRNQQDKNQNKDQNKNQYGRTIWTGTIIALSGTHPVNVASRDESGNTAWNNSTRYTAIGPTVDIEAKIRIRPKTLNLASKGVFTVFITLPEGYSADQIDFDTVDIASISAEKFIMAKKYGRTLILKFNRGDFKGTLVPEGVNNRIMGLIRENVKVIVTGRLIDGTYFEGSDTIRVINHDKENKKNDVNYNEKKNKNSDNGKITNQGRDNAKGKNK